MRGRAVLIADCLAPVNTETYHAQYRVLEAFSFFNMILSACL